VYRQKTIVCTQETNEPPVCASLRHPPALALCLPPHRHLCTSSPLALALSAIINKPHAKSPFSGFLQCQSNFIFTHSESHIRLECPRNTKVCTLCSDCMMYRHILMLTSRLLVVLLIRPHTLTSTRSSRHLPSREGSFRVRQDFHTNTLKRWKQFAPLFTILCSHGTSPMFDGVLHYSASRPLRQQKFFKILGQASVSYRVS
jgi:hypothetical protein